MSFSKPFGCYSDFVKGNPLLLRHVESAISWLPSLRLHFLVGDEKWATVYTEALYMTSSLLALVNDIILRREHALPISSSQAITTIKTILQVLDYSQLLLEKATLLFQGEHIRWGLITVIQSVKTVLRMILLFGFKQGMLLKPVVPALNREKDLQYALFLRQKRHEQRAQRTFLLKSGREVRTLEATPPLSKRRWCETQRVDPMLHVEEKFSFVPTRLTQQQVIGEILHMMTPIAHLAAMRIFGQQSWKPWLIAAGMDLLSIQQQKNTKLQSPEKRELNRRTVALATYLFKAPIYDRHVKERLQRILKNISATIPLAGYLEPEVNYYLDDVQKTYFRTWS